MRQTDKKQLRAILSKVEELQAMLETFAEEHQEWIDERNEETDDRFSYSASGERAEEEQSSFDEWKDNIESIAEEMQEMLGL